jgi:hypothetical protein
MAYEHTERWIPILDGRYEVSNQGKFRSTKTERIKRIHMSGCGYPYITISIAAHVLVAEAFHGPRPLGMEINHKDGDKSNFADSNLEYVTQLDNQQHAIRMKLKATALNGRHGRSKLTVQQAAEIRRLFRPAQKGEWGAFGHSALAKRFGVSRATIRQLLGGRSFHEL